LDVPGLSPTKLSTPLKERNVVMRKQIAVIIGFFVMTAIFASQSLAQDDGTAETIGRRIDKGLAQFSEEIQHAWANARRTVDELGVQGRVYGRLRWDKALADEPIDVEIQQTDTVVLTGRVPDEKTRQKAVRLAKDTVGVRDVVDRLRVEPRR
jgi:hypothetical protein